MAGDIMNELLPLIDQDNFSSSRLIAETMPHVNYLEYHYSLIERPLVFLKGNSAKT